MPSNLSFPRPCRESWQWGFRAQEMLTHMLSSPHPSLSLGPQAVVCLGDRHLQVRTGVQGNARGAQEQGTEMPSSFAEHPEVSSLLSSFHGPWIPKFFDLNSCHPLPATALPRCSLTSQSCSCVRALALAVPSAWKSLPPASTGLNLSPPSVLYSNVIFSMRQSQG